MRIFGISFLALLFTNLTIWILSVPRGIVFIHPNLILHFAIDAVFYSAALVISLLVTKRFFTVRRLEIPSFSFSFAVLTVFWSTLWILLFQRTIPSPRGLFQIFLYSILAYLFAKVLLDRKTGLLIRKPRENRL